MPPTTAGPCLLSCSIGVPGTGLADPVDITVGGVCSLKGLDDRSSEAIAEAGLVDIGIESVLVSACSTGCGSPGLVFFLGGGTVLDPVLCELWTLWRLLGRFVMPDVGVSSNLNATGSETGGIGSADCKPTA